MFRFEFPAHLYALLLIPILTTFFVVMRYNRRRALLRFGDADLVARLMPGVSNLKHPLKFVLLMLAMTLLVLAWANPQWGSKRTKTTNRTSDIIVALDISNSMLATDISPSRLERARASALDIVRELRTERIGFIIFAGNAYLQMPLTSDFAAATLFIKSANPKQAPTQGTALLEAIQMAEKAFPDDDRRSKALIIISDGEDHFSEDEIRARAEKAAEKGITIFTVGVGTSEGGTMLLDFGGLSDTKRAADGTPILTKLHEDILKRIAEASAGAYFKLSETNDIAAALKSEVAKLEKQEREARMFNNFESYFQWLLAAALIVLIIDFMMPYSRSSWEERNIFK
jgi:Ca-activated chloride channel homolog